MIPAFSLPDPWTAKVDSEDVGVTILYANPVAGTQARDVLRRLDHRLEGFCHFSIRFWAWADLPAPMVQRLVLPDLQDARLLVLSSDGTTRLPKAAWGCLQAWAGQPGRGSRALVWFSPGPGDNPAAAAEVGEIRSFARRHGLQFFCRNTPPTPSGTEKQPDVASGWSPRRWGIND